MLVFVVAMTSAAESYGSPVEELVASPEAAASPLDYDDSSYNRVRRSPHHHHHGGMFIFKGFVSPSSASVLLIM